VQYTIPPFTHRILVSPISGSFIYISGVDLKASGQDVCLFFFGDLFLASKKDIVIEYFTALSLSLPPQRHLSTPG
jgi:hypothetical protein